MLNNIVALSFVSIGTGILTLINIEKVLSFNTLTGGLLIITGYAAIMYASKYYDIKK